MFGPQIAIILRHKTAKTGLQLKWNGWLEAMWEDKHQIHMNCTLWRNTWPLKESSIREAQFFAEFLQQIGFKHPTPESRRSHSSYLKSLNTIRPPLSVIRHVLVSSSNTQNSDQNSSLYFTAPLLNTHCGLVHGWPFHLTSITGTGHGEKGDFRLFWKSNY